MKRNTQYPYILEKRDNIIRLEIGARKGWILPHLFVIFLTVIALIGSLLFVLIKDYASQKDYIIVPCLNIAFICFIIYALYIINWKRKGKEIFILYPNTLEHIIENKPYKISKQVILFSEIEFSYNSGVYFDSKEEGEALGIESDLFKVEGFYPIRFLIDNDGFIDSEREVPIGIIRRIREEYLLNQKDIS